MNIVVDQESCGKKIIKQCSKGLDNLILLHSTLPLHIYLPNPFCLMVTPFFEKYPYFPVDLIYIRTPTCVLHMSTGDYATCSNRRVPRARARLGNTQLV